jgi:hypothetical protein
MAVVPARAGRQEAKVGGKENVRDDVSGSLGGCRRSSFLASQVRRLQSA